jgi:glucose-6-phosphate isomerase, archaeal
VSQLPLAGPEDLKALAPWAVEIDMVSGGLSATDRIITRRASDMRGCYRDGAALERLIDRGNPVHYDVFEKLVPEQPGHLMVCISRLQPGRVGDEYFLTKGHYHDVVGTAEVYLCLRGRGYMLMKTMAGQKAAVPMVRNQLVYVPPSWAHRSVNTGDEPLVSLCVYPAEAGHNYAEIAATGFPQQVVLRDGHAVVEVQPR